MSLISNIKRVGNSVIAVFKDGTMEKLGGSILWQNKAMTADAGASGDIAALQFNNLEIGKTYRATCHFYVDRSGAGDLNTTNITLRSASGGGGTEYMHRAAKLDAASDFNANGVVFPISGFVIFQAVSSNLYTNLTLGSGLTLRGTASGLFSYVTLEELPNHQPTTKWI